MLSVLPFCSINAHIDPDMILHHIGLDLFNCKVSYFYGIFSLINPYFILLFEN